MNLLFAVWRENVTNFWIKLKKEKVTDEIQQH